MSATDHHTAETDSPLPLPPPGLLTRRKAAQYINDTLGRPMSFSTATKLAAVGEFAQPKLWWGRRPLYRTEDLERWAEGRSSYKRPSLKATQPAARDGASSAAQEAAPAPKAAGSSRTADKRTGNASRRHVEATAGA